MANYTKVNSLTGTTYPKWHDVVLSNVTKERRDQIKRGMDNFTSFTWRGIDAFDVFGAFIINDKNSLKFYNGPSFSNSYTKPQFESAYGQLTGITFNIQKIDFNIGVYWISEDHYRQLIYWLNPYEINTLTFGFQPDYYYQVKLSSRADSTRHIVGYEGTEPMYYTEMKLSFEVQGPACAYYARQYTTKSSSETSDSQANMYTVTYEIDLGEPESPTTDVPLMTDLATPIEAVINVRPYGTGAGTYFMVSLSAQYDDNEPIDLFDVTFQNFTVSSNINQYGWNLKYESDSGLLLLDVADSEYMLLNQLYTSTEGKRIVRDIIVNHFEIPGRFDDCQFDLSLLKFTITVQSDIQTGISTPSVWFKNANFNIRARTNLI